MSKIEFHRTLKKEIGNIFEIDAKLTEFIKNYVNDLNTLPPIDEAVYFIINNYKSEMRPVHIVRIKGVRFAAPYTYTYPKLPNFEGPPLCSIVIKTGLLGLFIGYAIYQFI